jgi:HAD superfamily phosphatase (TIGR01668 family)
MITLITPHLQLASVVDLDLACLRALGLEGLLLDIDGTLKHYHASECSAPVTAWVRSLQAGGIRLCLLSNGKPGRVGTFADKLGVPWIAKAFKPLPFGCWKALRRLGLSPVRTALVGDQLFADVLAGRLAGLFTIFVPPLHVQEPWFTRLKRPLERRVLRWLNGPTGSGGAPPRVRGNSRAGNGRPVETDDVETRRNAPAPLEEERLIHVLP